VTAQVVTPSFTAQPISQSVVPGTTALFSASATGGGVITYQWTKDGVALAGATSPALTLPAVTQVSAGSYRVIATNSAGSAESLAATLAVSETAYAPLVEIAPAMQKVSAKGRASFNARVTGVGPISYQWTKDGAAIAGATSATLVIDEATVNEAGLYRVIVHNSAGSTHSQAATLLVEAAMSPVILTQPLSQFVVEGADLTFAVDVEGTPPFAYQWNRGGRAITGATGATLTLNPVQPTDADEYSVTVTNASGGTVSNLASLGVTSSVSSAITNVSVLTTLEAEQLLVVGFNVSGGFKPLLVRAAGPGLNIFGVSGTMPNPRIALFQDATMTGANDDWNGNPILSAAFTAVGAFGLAPDSLDAALLSSVGGGRTAQIRGTSGGKVLVELYDAGTGVNPRLTNVSARNRVAPGAGVLIAGLTISGTTPRTVLVRAVGPSLAAFGVPSVLADPKFEIYRSGTKIMENDTWAPSLATTFAKVGAFGLLDGSKDAALVVSLPPGGYTIQVSGADGGTGEALVEVFEIQP